jgi:hypothetical protein
LIDLLASAHISRFLSFCSLWVIYGLLPPQADSFSPGRIRGFLRLAYFGRFVRSACSKKFVISACSSKFVRPACFGKFIKSAYFGTLLMLDACLVDLLNLSPLKGQFFY